MTKSIESLLKTHGLMHLRSEIEASAAPSVAICHSKNDVAPRAKRSFLGGMPQVLHGTAAPNGRFGPMSLLATLYFSEITNREDARCCPSSGVLQLWLDVVGTADDPALWYSPDSFAVRYSPSETTALVETPVPSSYLKRKEFPAKLVFFHRVPIEFAPMLSLPIPCPIESDDADQEAYEDMVINSLRCGEPCHQMLGYSHFLQATHAERQRTCLWRAHGLLGKRGDPAKTAKGRSLLPHAADWVLLMQLDSDPRTGWMWGDAGLLYFFIEKSALERADFSRVQLVMECA